MKRRTLSRRNSRKSKLRQQQRRRAVGLSVERLEPRMMLSVGDPYVDLNIVTDWSEAGFTDRGYDVAVQTDGKMVVAGVRAKSIMQSSQDLLVARYNADGTIDTTFNGTGYAVYDFGEFYRDIGTDIAIGSDGSIVVAAMAIEYYTDPSVESDNFVARFNSDGTLDKTFRIGAPIVPTNDLLVLSTGKILFLSKVTNPIDQKKALKLTQLNSDMTLDTSFGSGGSVVHDALGLGRANAGLAMAEQSDGKIVVAGRARPIEGAGPVGYSVRFLADGNLDMSYGSGGEVAIDPSENIKALAHIALDANDNAYFVQWAGSTPGDKQFNAVKIDSTGSLDTSFADGGIFRYSMAPAQETSGSGSGNGIAVDQDGQLYLSGNIVHSGGQTDGVIIRVNTEGALDTTFGYNGSIIVGNGGTLRGMTIDTLNRPVIAGEASSVVNGMNSINTWLLRIDPRDGEIATTTYNSAEYADDADVFPMALKDAKGKNSGKTNSTLTIDDAFEILDLNVQLDIWHTWDADLDVFLISPSGTRVELFTDVGGDFDNFTGTTIDDQASTSITLAAAPFTGVFQPEGLLSAFNTQNTSGTWTLEIQDDENFEIGTLNSWSIVVTHPTSSVNTDPVADAGGPYSGLQGSDVTLDASASSDADGTIVDYQWDLDNDGQYDDAAGATATFNSATAGNYTVGVRVTDDGGKTDTDTAIVTVTDPSAGQIFTSGDVPKTIADPHKKRGPRPATSQLTPSGTGTVVDTVTVAVTIDHAQEAGLTVTLTSPANTVASSSYVGGNWQIDNPAAFSGEDLDGTWKLTVTDTDRDGVTGTLQAWSITVTPLSAASSQSTAAAVDMALLAWFDLDSTDDEETDPWTESLVDDLALMLV